MSNNSLNTILKVKLDGQNWSELPVVRGSGVYTLPAVPTQRTIIESGVETVQTGYILKIVDEKKKISDPTYDHDEYTIWNGLDGIGSVNSVDGITVNSGTTNISLKAVSYGRDQSSLTANEQSQARSNINAQIAGNYIVSPQNKVTNQFLQYLGNDTWTTSTVQVLPASETVGMLMKTSASADSLVWMPALSSSEIDEIIDNN